MATLEVDCIVLFGYLWRKNQTIHGSTFTANPSNIESCWACGEKRIFRTETDAKWQCNSATEFVSFAILW
ncbi:MAG: hypothetical protein M1167_01040 [Chloroflexi bacterium]|nr:hypothetical protein [Chloroflexota bacterium]